MKNKTLVIAHRGFSGEYLQNSKKALQEAIKLKVDMIEIDVRKTKDSNFIVFHDAHLQRLTYSRGYVNNKTLEDIKKILLKEDSKILELKEALQILKKSKINIHLKDYFCKEDFIKLLKEIKSYEKNIIISSFNFDDLHELRKLNKKIKIGLLCVLPFKKNIKKSLQLKAYSIHPNYSFLTYGFVKLAQKNNLKVFPFTINNPNSMKHLIHFGVDGIITNYPDKLQDLIKKIIR